MNTQTHTAPQFAVCINNDGYQASLEIGKLYQVIPDDDDASHGYIRVVDESGEDYGYLLIGGADGKCVAPPRSPQGDDMNTHFFVLDVPQALANALKKAA